MGKQNKMIEFDYTYVDRVLDNGKKIKGGTIFSVEFVENELIELSMETYQPMSDYPDCTDYAGITMNLEDMRKLRDYLDMYISASEQTY